MRLPRRLKAATMIGAFVAALATASGSSAEQNPLDPAKSVQAPAPDLIYVTVSVVDKDRNAVRGLEKSHFKIWEDGVEQKVALFSVETAPISCGFYWGPSVPLGDFMTTFLKGSAPETEYFVVGNDTVAVPFNNDARRVPRVLPQNDYELRPSNGKDSIHISFDVLSEAAAYPRRVLIVVTRISRLNRVKYLELRSKGSWGELRRYAMEQGVQVYTVLVEGQATDLLDNTRTPTPRNEAGNLTAGDQNIVQDADEEADYEALQKLATATGGRTYQARDPNFGGFTDTHELEEFADEIARGLRVQYRIGYVPSNRAKDGKFRKLRVSVSPPPGSGKLEAWTKDGYYAPKTASSK
jgi:VWFA-related protein